MINNQLDTMITKLKGKLQQEVQQRIENQKKLTRHIQNLGSHIENQLVAQFQMELQDMNEKLDSFEQNLREWQPDCLR